MYISTHQNYKNIDLKMFSVIASKLMVIKVRIQIDNTALRF